VGSGKGRGNTTALSQSSSRHGRKTLRPNGRECGYTLFFSICYFLMKLGNWTKNVPGQGWKCRILEFDSGKNTNIIGLKQIQLILKPSLW
jgi:hypothetical protein